MIGRIGRKLLTGRASQIQVGESDGASSAGNPPTGRYGRRALMLGAAATGAGVAASLAGGGMAEAAPDAGGAVQLGKSNKASTTTIVTAAHGTGFEGRAASAGHAGVAGFDDTTSKANHGFGVNGTSMFGPGVIGFSGHHSGIVGNTVTVGHSGVVGIDNCKTSGAHGTYGQTVHGDGVFGFGIQGNGVSGESRTPGKSALKGVDKAPHGGNALFAQSVHGTAVWASSGGGTALKVDGKMTFSHSGLAHVPSGSKSTSVKLAGVKPTSMVLATLQVPQSSTAVAAAQAGTGQFTITLTNSAKSDLPVAWFVID